MESGSAPAAIRLTAAPLGFPGTGLAYAYIRCTDPGHLTSGIATASTSSPVPDSTAAPTAAPELTMSPTSMLPALSYATISVAAVCVSINTS